MLLQSFWYRMEKCCKSQSLLTNVGAGAQEEEGTRGATALHRSFQLNRSSTQQGLHVHLSSSSLNNDTSWELWRSDPLFNGNTCIKPFKENTYTLNLYQKFQTSRNVASVWCLGTVWLKSQLCKLLCMRRFKSSPWRTIHPAEAPAPGFSIRLYWRQGLWKRANFQDKLGCCVKSFFGGRPLVPRWRASTWDRHASVAYSHLYSQSAQTLPTVPAC